MTQDLGTAVLTLTTDVRGVSTGIDQANSELNRLGTTAEQTNKRLDFGQLAASVALVTTGVDRMAGGLQGGLQQLSRFTTELAYINGQSATIRTVFGEAADSVFEFSRNSAQAAGLSSKSFEQLIAPVGTLLTNLVGLNKPEAAAWAIDLTQRAADLAFTFDTDVSTAVNAVGAAIRGENEPIRQYGIAFNAATVEAKAMAMTGKTVTKELTEQDKAMARVALIMEQSSEFAGSFANNQDLLFVKAQQANAEMENQAGLLGAKLIPVQTKLLDLFQALPEEVRLAGFAFAQFAPPVFEFASGLALTGTGIAGLVTLLPSLIIPLTIVGVAIGTLAVIVVAFNIDLGDLISLVNEAVRAFELFVLGLQGGQIGGEFTWIQQAAFNLGQTLRNDIIPTVTLVAGQVADIATKIAQWAVESGVLQLALDGFLIIIDLVRVSLEFLVPLIAQVVDWLARNEVIAYAVVGGFIAMLAPIALVAASIGFLLVAVALADDAWRAFRDTLQSIWEALPGPLAAALTFIAGIITTSFQFIATTVLPIVFSLVGAIIDGFNLIAAVVPGVVNFVAGAVTAAWAFISGTVIPIVFGIVGAIVDGFNFIAGVIATVTAVIVENIVQGWPGQIFNLIVGVVGAIVGFVAANWPIIAGVIQGVTDFIIGIVNFAWPYIQGVIGFAMDVILGIITFAWNFISAHIVNNLLFIVNMVTTHWETIRGTIDRIAGIIMGIVQGLVDTMIRILDIGLALIFGNWDRAWNGMKDLVDRIGGELFGIVDGIVRGILDHMDSLPGDLLQLGKDAINELGRGMTDAAGGLLEKAGDIAGDVLGEIKSGFGIFSPSREMYEVGRQLINGLENGIAGKLPSLKEMAGKVQDTFIGQIGAIGGAGVERWRGLVSAFFPPNEVQRALNVMALESGGNPLAIGKNANGSIDVGLFQINSIHGQPLAAMLNPLSNVAFAANLFARQGWGPWVAAHKLGYAHGGLDYVPTEGIYLLDQGEAVLSADENRRGRAVFYNTFNISGPNPEDIARYIERRQAKQLRLAKVGMP